MLSLLLLTGLPVPGMTGSPPSTEASAIAACSNWMADRAPDIPAETKAVDGGLCFDGDISKVSSDAFLQAFTVKKGPMVVVVRSDGGDVKSALDMAEAIASRETTVVATYKCISSCANYILPAGKRRVVLPDTVLLFHGGANLDHVEESVEGVRKYYADRKLPDPEKNMVNVMTDLTGLVERQDRFLQKVGISRTFFRWMNLFNYMGSEEQAKHCANPSSQVVLYPPVVLAEFGYRIDDYRGPSNDLELLESLNRMHKSDDAKDICVWH